jgi:hypothetical protein
MRRFAYAMLTDPTRAAALLLKVPAGRINSTGSGTPTPPFIVIRNRQTIPRFKGAVNQGGMTVHIHDKPESYKQIDEIGALVDDVLMNSVPQQWDSVWVSQIEHLGWSEDLFDDHYKTATRFVTYALNHRP